MNKYLFLVALVVFLSENAMAGVWVKGNIFSSTQCHYGWEEIGRFQVNYQNQLPWGTKIKLRYGFHNNMGANSYWQQMGETSLNAVSPNTWQATLQSVVAQRGGYSYNFLEFVFQLTLPNGQTYFDNGGQGPMGYYGSPISKLSATCEPSDLEPLPVLNLHERDSHEQNQ